MAWLTGITPESGYAAALLGPLLITGAGTGLAISPSMNTATFRLPPADAVALAAVHGYTTAFWWATGILAAGAVIRGTLLRRGPPGPRRPAGRAKRPDATAC